MNETENTKKTQWKTISIPLEVYNGLIEAGKMSDSFGTLIARLLEANGADRALVTSDK
jgi:predicted CopG family antitoxin